MKKKKPNFDLYGAASDTVLLNICRWRCYPLGLAQKPAALPFRKYKQNLGLPISFVRYLTHSFIHRCSYVGTSKH